MAIKVTRQVVKVLKEAKVTLTMSPEAAALALIVITQASGSPDISLRKYADEFMQIFSDEGIEGYDIQDDDYSSLASEITVDLCKTNLANPYFLKLVDRIKDLAG